MTDKHLLLIGASRGLGLAMAAELLKTAWNVVGTVRGNARTGLHDLADAHPGRVEIESLEVAAQQVAGQQLARTQAAGFDRFARQRHSSAPRRQT